MNDVLVIGAGMAGFSAARELRRAGLSVRVLEAGDHVGGRVYSIRDFCAEPVEAGAEFIHGVGAATFPDIKAGGFTVRPCPLIRHTMFNLGHGTHWLPLLLLHPETWPTFTIMRLLKNLRAPDISARQFIERQGYTGRGRLLAEMTCTAHLPGSIDEVGLMGLREDGVLTIENGLNHRLAEGYDSLISHIGTGTDLALGFRVERVRWDARGVTVTADDGREESARACVSTLPLGVLQSGRVQFAPELPESKRSAMTRLQVGPVVKVLLSFKERFWPSWLANLCCGDGPVTLYWPVFYNRGASTDGRPPVLIAYATGPRAARLSALSEQEAADTCVRDLARLLPKTDPRRLFVAARKVDWATDPLACGGYSFVRPGGSGGPRALLAAADTGALFWAGSATQTTPIAETVEAAFLSGRRAADEVLRHLDSKATGR
jgi:monoamine oxidase